MAINLHQLKIFHTVARLGSFSRAAAELLISQPSVSIQVGELERQFGVELFEQAGKSVRLTEAGRVLDEYAARILALVEETKRAVEEVKGLARGRLTLGATPTPGTYILPELLGAFKERYPRLDLVWRIAGPDRVQAMVLQREVDLGVIGWRVTFPSLEAVPMATDEMVLVVAASHPLAAKPSVELAETLREPWVMCPRGSGLRDAVDEALHGAGVHVTPTLELESAEAVKQAVAANLGISILSRRAVDLEVAAGRLHAVPLRELRIERVIWLIYPRDRRLSRTAQAFVEFALARRDQEKSPGPEEPVRAPAPD